MHTDTGVNGINEPAVYAVLGSVSWDDEPQLAIDITREIDVMTGRAAVATAENAGKLDSAIRFLVRARSIARDAMRVDGLKREEKLKQAASIRDAAYTVLLGGGGDE